MIDQFRGRWVKLGNYSLCTIFYEGHAYGSVEHAYQAQKTKEPVFQKSIRDCATPALAKKAARALPLRDDWDSIKDGIMLALLREKFASEPERSILLSTQDEQLVEGNWWNDRYWGQTLPVTWPQLTNGLNKLGTFLMQVRAEIRLEEAGLSPQIYAKKEVI